MAKDPAFPFYTQDFITGTMFMSNEHVGIYIRLLCAQHQHGGFISKNAFESMVGKENGIIREKFIECEDGFYNARLMKEMVKRRKKSCNLSANALKRWEKEHKKDAIALQMDMPTEDENENEIVFGNTEKGGVGEKTIIGEVIEQWQQSGLTVEISESKDIRELCEKILNIKDISQADEQKRHELLGVMQKIISWVKSENNIKYYGSLKSINNNFSKIINSLKNGTKQTKRTGEGSSPDELAEIVRRRFSDKQKGCNQ